MKRIFEVFFLLIKMLCTYDIALGQKKQIGQDSYKNWRWLNEYGYRLSNNGRYVTYDVRSVKSINNYGVVVKSSGQEILKTGYRTRAEFSADSRFLVSQLNGDSLHVFDLNRKSARIISPANNFSLSTIGNVDFLIYQSGETLCVNNLLTGNINTQNKITEHKATRSGQSLILRTPEGLLWLDILSNHLRRIFTGSASNLTTGDSDIVAFIHTQGANADIYYFSKDMDSARLLIANASATLNSKYYTANEPIRFSADDKRLYFQTKKKNSVKNKSSEYYTEDLEVWNYQQHALYAGLKNDFPDFRPYKMVIGLEPASKPIELEDDSTSLIGEYGNKYVLTKTTLREEEGYFDDSRVPLYTLISLKDGSRKIFRHRSNQLIEPVMSAAERFIVWVNLGDAEMYTYEMATGETKNVSQGIKIPLDMKIDKYGSRPHKLSFFPLRWLNNDEAFLVGDRYDLWMIDPKGKKAPINITAGYGRANRISFSPAFRPEDDNSSFPLGRLILRGRSEDTGDNGFWQTSMNFSEPYKLIMRPCMYSWHKVDEPRRLYKAGDADVYLVTMQSAAQSPNLYISKDLKNFKQLSFIEPEKEYNWMTSEMITWKKYDGQTGRGILYKPENFDSSKKYPVIFHVYQERIAELHDYRRPLIEPNQIDIPWYVSNGYLVCIPDIINTRPGYIAETVVNSVESAARYLGAFSWIDSTKFGIQGHSFGGYEALLLIAHSKKFAAAQASAAVCDLVSAIGNMGFGDHELYSFHEMGQGNMGPGNLPWTNPQGYVESSPIFYADKISTPLLLMHGYEDQNVKFTQDIEMFSALRRLRKPVWILAYKDGHVLSRNEQIGLDASIRQKQFFDHYLKGKPAPVWMTKGVLPQDRLFESGLQFDSLSTPLNVSN